jgi:hypothetical protein
VGDGLQVLDRDPELGGGTSRHMLREERGVDTAGFDRVEVGHEETI